MKTRTRVIPLFLISFLFSFLLSVEALAATNTVTDTGLTGDVLAQDYVNWEAVSDISQFKDKSGNYMFAYNHGNQVDIYRADQGKAEKKVTLKKPNPLFGAVTCDKDGYYYLVTGKNNEGSTSSVNTIFVSKYDPTGKLVKTVGDQGHSSMSYYDDSFLTKNPLWLVTVILL